MNIINMSLGLDGPSHALRTSIYRAYRKGIVIVASSGNSGPHNASIDVPAIYPETIAVAATDRQKRIPDFSSRGYGIDVSAPGDRIVSTNHLNGFSMDTGTSMAPHVSGTIALMLSVDPQLSPDHIREILKETALPDHHANIYEQGAGLIHAQAAVNRAGSHSNTWKRKRKASAIQRRPPSAYSPTQAQASRKQSGSAASSVHSRRLSHTARALSQLRRGKNKR